MLLRHDRQPSVTAVPPVVPPLKAPPLPPGVTDTERAALARAQVRIPRKWRALEKMLADYAGSDDVLRGHRA